MKRPTPIPGLLACVGWLSAAVVLTPFLLPPRPPYRTCVAGVALVLFSAALLAPRVAFVLAMSAVSLAGVSALLFGAPEPAMAGPIVLAGFFAGRALRDIYQIHAPPLRAPLLPVWRAFGVVSAVSALSAYVGARSGYLLFRGVPPPRIVNLLGEDASQAIVGSLAALAALGVAVGFHRAAAALGRDAAGRRAIDVALLAAALLPGLVGLFQKLGVFPLWRALRWQEWERAQSTFTDPSAAGVGVALLLAPLLACAASSPPLVRVLSGISVGLLLLILADAGSRAGLIGSLVAGSFFVLWSATRLAVESRHGGSHRVASTMLTLALVSAVAFGIALSSPGRGSVRSVLATRLMATFRTQPTPSETRGERVLLYEGALALFREHPVAGIGLGGFRTEFPNVATEVLLHPAKSTDHPPSLYLGTLVESGLAGAALLLLVLLGTARGFGSALVFRGENLEDSLRSLGAAAAVLALLVVFLFGSHIVYSEIAALAGILTARLPLSPDGRTSRMLGALMPVFLAGALVLLVGGIVARAYETRLPEAAFARSDTAGLFSGESEGEGRRFRWTSSAAAWRIGGVQPERNEGGPSRPAFSPSRIFLPVRNARPDARPVSLAIYWNDTLRGRVVLPAGGWRRLTLPIDSPGVLRIHLSTVFRPPFDPRTLGIEVGLEPVVAVRGPG